MSCNMMDLKVYLIVSYMDNRMEDKIMLFTKTGTVLNHARLN